MSEKAKVVVVTGAARGMGQTHCIVLARKGYHVCATDVLPVDDTVARIKSEGGFASAHMLDVGSEASWTELCSGLHRFGTPYGLVNNAGINDRQSIVDETLAGWSQVMNVNLDGPFLGMRHLAPILRDAGGGAIVNVASAAGLMGYRGAAYTASKWGLRGLTKTAASEFGPWGIRVNTVNPGIIDTPLVQANAGFIRSHLKSVPLGRVGVGADVSETIAFLLSHEASYITGADLSVDGGFVSSGSYWRIYQESERDPSR